MNSFISIFPMKTKKSYKTSELFTKNTVWAISEHCAVYALSSLIDGRFITAAATHIYTLHWIENVFAPMV